MIATIYKGDALTALRKMSDNSIHCEKRVWDSAEKVKEWVDWRVVEV